MDPQKLRPGSERQILVFWVLMSIALVFSHLLNTTIGQQEVPDQVVPLGTSLTF